MSQSLAPASKRHGAAWKIAAGIAAFVLLLVLVVALFPWNLLREPINRMVSERTGRKFEITQRLDVGVGLRQATVRLDGVEFANPAWARQPYLVQAQRAEVDVRLWPLLMGRIVLPRIALTQPALGLQMEEDGRKTWSLGKDTSDEGNVPVIGALLVDQGSLDFLAPALGIDLQAQFSNDPSRGEKPLRFDIEGRYQGAPLQATGATGSVLQLQAEGQTPFPFEFQGANGSTQLSAQGRIGAMSTLEGIDAEFEIKGASLGRLYDLLGVALPETSPYRLSGRLRRDGALWQVSSLKGKLGISDIEGDMRFDQAPQVPKLSGNLRSAVMDMDDLGPLIGLPPTDRASKAVEGVPPPPSIEEVRPRSGRPEKVLPTATLDFERLKAMNADVKYAAARIRNVRGLPLDDGSVHVKLQDGVLSLEPLVLGIASGKAQGSIRIDSTKDPADIRAALEFRALRINRMIPKVETLRTSFGNVSGHVRLSGRGNSVASWLGASSGEFAAMTGRGKFSNLLLEFMGLDGGEVFKFLLGGDQNVVLRCAAIAFDVQQGTMRSQEMLFDTQDTVFRAVGHVDLSKETMRFVIEQKPKDVSILSVRTPLVIDGSFLSPSVGVKAAPLVERGLAALALGAINPLLALAATIETGPGEDADCREAIAQTRDGAASASRRNAPAGARR